MCMERDGVQIATQNPKYFSAQIGMLLFLAAEAMFFAGLISAFWVLRASLVSWPPDGQTRLPIFVTACNTVVLLFSGFMLWQARLKRKYWWWAVAAGFLFLIIQGSEWLKLMSFGFTAAHNTYAGLFYVLVGAHAAHVLGGLIFLILSRDAWAKDQPEPSLYYWTFVVLLWPLLYALVYF